MYKNLSPGAIGIGANLAESVCLAREHGFAGVDISIEEVAQIAEAQSVEAVRALLGEVRPGGWGLPLDWRAEESKFREGLAQLPRYARLGQAIGADRVTMWLLPYSDELPFAENFRFHVRASRQSPRCWPTMAAGSGWSSSARRRCATARSMASSTPWMACWHCARRSATTSACSSMPGIGTPPTARWRSWIT